MKKGKFIVFEGINACGKGTQISLLQSHIRSLGKAVPLFLTGEPNGFDENGKKAREMLSTDGDPYQNAVEAVGYFAKNRISHQEYINWNIGRGITVLSDRYWHSNFAFQHAQEVSYEDIANANRGSRVPDLTLLLDVSLDVALERLDGRDGEERRKFDSDGDFLNKARNNYFELSRVLPELIGDNSIVVIDGNRTPEKVFEDVRKTYDSLRTP